MKFSHSVQFNAVPEWQKHYIAYSNLKKLIYTLEKQVNSGKPPVPDGEIAPLLSGTQDDVDMIFSQNLDKELKKITSFYETKEQEIFEEADEVLNEEPEVFEDIDDDMDPEGQAANGRRMSRRPRKSSVFGHWAFGGRRKTSIGGGRPPQLERIESVDSDEEAEDQQQPPQSPQSPKRQRSNTMVSRRSMTEDDLLSSPELTMGASMRRQSMAVEDPPSEPERTYKKRMIKIFVSLSELRSFVQLNKTGFTKVLKKYDKTLDRNLRPVYVSEKVETQYTFKKETSDTIGERISQVEESFARLYNGGNLSQAKRELRLDLREHVVWERNTVWRDLIGIERKAQAANVGVRKTLMGREHDPNKRRLQGDEDDHGAHKEFKTPIGRFSCPQFLLHSPFYVLTASFAIFMALVFVPLMEVPEQQNCLALVVFVSLLWATEAIPLFVTAMLVPFLVVILRVVRTDQRPHYRLESKPAATYIFAAMWTPVIMLLLGGFTIAAALSKYNIAKVVATFVLSKAGTRPRNVLLTNMFVAAFLSMWISNVASPVLCFSIIQPILRNLPSDSNMIKALLLGIALSSNIGGMASPIASPQNLIALQNMAPEPGWGIWFFVTLPVCIVSILLIWLMLLITLRPGRDSNIVPIRPVRDPFSPTQWFISGVTLLTIVLWCLSHRLEPVFGDMGVIAVLPILVFFGAGILTKEDFNNFLWTIIILAAGGLALGKAVSSSGLLHTLAESITAHLNGMSLYGVMVVFSAMILVIACFISHTVAALIVLPLVKQVGEGMDQPRPNLLVMGSVLMCSAAMALPTSGFPNMTAIMMEDQQTGQRYLGVKDFITRGIPASLLTFVVMISLGYGLMRVAGI